MGVNTSETEFNTVNKTGGDKAVTLTVDQIPSHSHGIKGGWGGPGPLDASFFRTDQNCPKTRWNSTDTSGGSQAHKNIQPYQTCYFWRRTA